MREREYFDTLCNTGDGVFIVDAGKHIVRWNKGAEKLLKFSESDVLNHDCHEVISGRVSAEKPWCGHNCKIHSGVMKGSLHKNFDLWTHTSEGEPIWLNISIIAPMGTDELFVAHIIRDMTREKKTLLALDNFLASLGNGSPGSEISLEKPIGKHFGSIAGPSPAAPVALSSREIEVLTLLAEGLATKGLAEKLGISHFTARNHIQNILVKLNLHSKAQAVSYAFKKGIL